MAISELGRRENYVGEKYLIESYKDIQKNILKTSNVLKNYGVSTPLKDVVVKNYYDTDDLFFRKLGINISVNIYKGRPYADLVVRYDSEQERIQFISDIPDTYIKKVGKKDHISKHFEYIATAIGELMPSGIGVEPIEVVKLLKLKISIKKKRERYRVIHSNGLKVILSFEQSVYSNAKHAKVKLNILELRLDSPYETSTLFQKFMQELRLAEVRMIKTKHSDLFIGQDYLDIV